VNRWPNFGSRHLAVFSFLEVNFPQEGNNFRTLKSGKQQVTSKEKVKILLI